MIVHDNHRKPTQVRAVNSRLPIYSVIYGNGLGDVIRGLFTRIAPKVAPVAKQLSMKAIDIVRDKAPGAIVNVAGKAFSAIKERLARLLRRKQQPPVKLASTEVMPADVSKIINQAANQKLAAISEEAEKNITANLIAGSGLRRR